MKSKPFFITAAVSLLLLSSCKTYYISVDSFRRQFASLDTSGLRRVVTKDPWDDKTFYKTYPVDTILCVDKNGTNMVMKNGPSIEIRFIDTENKRTTFYFDLIRISNDTVMGIRSRLIPSIKKSIPLSKVKTIEIQDGGKKYSYVK
jgi:hypothetical protein